MVFNSKDVLSHIDSVGRNTIYFDSELVALLDDSTAEPTVLLSGRACKILHFLMASPNKIFSVSEIQQGVWGKTVVTAGSVKDYIAQIRAALNDSATEPTFVQTIRGRGYRYLGGITTSKNQVIKAQLLPTLAIVPPVINGDTRQVGAMAGEIIAAILINSISQSPLINTISRLSTRQFKYGQQDLETIGTALGADYLLSGIYHCTDVELVLLVELSSVSDSTVVWADTLIGNISHWGNSNSTALKKLAGTVVNEIIQHQIELTSSEPIDSLAAHTLIINAITCMHSSSQTIFNQAEKLLQNADTVIPNNATVLALLAQWHLMSLNRSQGWAFNKNTTFRDDAVRYVETALEFNPLHAHANTIIGSLEARLNNNFDKALDHHAVAMRSNPNCALNHCFTASAYTYQDRSVGEKIAVLHANRAIKLSPMDPQIYLFKTVAAAVNLYAGNLVEARQLAMESHAMNPNHTSNLRTLISILIELQQKKAAFAMKDKLMVLDPTFTVEAYREFGPGSQSCFNHRVAQNLEEAGVPVQ